MSAPAISGFRRLFRASRKAFRGDTYALKNASVALKAEFAKNRMVTDKNELGELRISEVVNDFEIILFIHLLFPMLRCI
jgi:hypothetical protein